MNDVPVCVCEHLKFDVPWTLQISFEQHGVVAERRQRLAFRRFKRLVKCVDFLDDSHTAPAAAGARFDQ